MRNSRESYIEPSSRELTVTSLGPWGMHVRWAVDAADTHWEQSGKTHQQNIHNVQERKRTRRNGGDANVLEPKVITEC